MPDSDTPPSSAAPKPRRTFFKKASWQTKKSNDDPMALFDGSQQTYSALKAEEERKRKEAEVRKREQELAARKEKEERERQLEEQREGKRRRISHDTEDNDLEDLGAVAAEGCMAKSGSPLDDKRPAVLSSSPPTKRYSTSLSLRYEEITKRSESTRAERSGDDGTRIGETGPPKKDPVIIALDNSESEDYTAGAGTKKEAPAKPVDPDDDIDESDDEIREMILESRRKKRLFEAQRARATPPIASGLERQGSASSLGAGTPLSPSQPDPPVHILIDPRIPNTKPLLVTRRLSQRLKEVREAWCARQGFDEATTQTIYLTHRGVKIYDVATSRSLGLSLNSEGQLVNRNFRGSDWDEDNSKVVLQATTKEIHKADMEEAKRKMERQTTPEPGPEPKEKQIRVVIKTKYHNDCKFIVKPSTEFGKMARSALNKMKLEPSSKPYLCFDGERLDPNGSMADLDDFEDGDAIDMYFE